MIKKNANRAKFIFAIILLAACSIAYFGCADEAGNRLEDKNAAQIELISECMDIVRSEYVEEVDPQKLCYGALGGMLSSLDGYSDFLDPEEFKEMTVDTKGEFGGLGMEVGIRDNILTVIAPIDRTPAARAGIKAQDKIIKIDGEITRNLKLNEAVKKLRGRPGTKVKLTIFREDKDKILEFTIARKIIKIDSVTDAKMLDEKIAHIKLSEFQQDSPKELEKALLALQKNGMKALIFDLRNNPGGLLEVAVALTGKFLKKDRTIVSIKGRSPQSHKVYKAGGGKKFLDFPIVILVNGGSASASEIVAGAIKDNRRGIVLGTKTFGKGSVQTVIPLKDGSALKFTTADYYTPNGHVIKDKGVTPDVEIKLTEDKPILKEKEDVYEKVDNASVDGQKKKLAKYDNQLKAAKDVLLGVLAYRDVGYLPNDLSQKTTR